MQVVSIIADSATDAVAQIKDQLGPEALVLNVRKLPPQGLSRLWQKPRIEVLACAGATTPKEETEIKNEPDLRRQQTPGNGEAQGARLISSAADLADLPSEAATPFETNWRVARLLESTGMTHLSVGRVLDGLAQRFGPNPPATLGEELQMARLVLGDLWKKPFQAKARRRPLVHVFVGPAGSGKTAALCKWLTLSTLMENRPADVWRLDGATANTAESLSVYCEILGVPLHRLWQGTPPANGGNAFVDLPGVPWSDRAAVQALRAQLQDFPSAQIHLVLNAAYETGILQSQLRAFSSLPIDDLIFTHLDEETRWGKIWNFVLGTNYSVRFLSAGQNVPGEFVEATPERIFSRQFSCK